MRYSVQLIVLTLLTTLGCNCSSLPGKTNAKLITISTEEAQIRMPIPVAPAPPENFECRSPTILTRAKSITPTIGFIVTTAPADGTDQLDSLAIGMGIEPVCCGSLMALSALRKMDSDDIEGGPEASIQRLTGYIFSRCFEKPAEKSLSHI